MQPTSAASRIADSAAVYSPRVLKVYDRWVLGFSNSHAWMCPTDSVLLPFFRRHMSANHLDVGVGSGFYLDQSEFLPGQKVTLLDVNENSLNAAANRIVRLEPTMVLEDVLHPRGVLGDQQFDSISLFYLLHCLPGQMSRKGGKVFQFLRKHLSAEGTLYGATVLGDLSDHNWLGRRLMWLYNRNGIFGNRQDTLHSLDFALRLHFAEVSVWQQGHVALFQAEKPLG